MTRKLSVFLVFLFVIGFVGQAYAGGTFSIDSINNKEILVSSAEQGPNMRVLVEKDKERYYYSINEEQETLPLQLGKGNYTVKLLQHKSGKTYKVVHKQDIKVSKFNEKEAFLVSAQPVYWKGGQAEKLAKKIFNKNDSDKKKLEKAYEYLVKNVKYDYNKIKNIDDSYTPNNDVTIKELSGICYDYASLMAGLLRSQGIPTKLVKGYKNDIKTYHAWNEVLIDGKWVIIDTTYDAALFKGSKSKNVAKLPMIKANKEYTKVREY